MGCNRMLCAITLCSSFQSSQGDVPVPKVQGHGLGKDEYFLLSERINESLKLSQALHDTRNLEGLSPEHWRSFGTQDLKKRGMLQAEAEPLVSKTGKRRL